jgi:hypothetical protein
MDNSLGSIITNHTARKVVYGLYVIVALAAAAIQVAYSSLGMAEPAWLIAALAVLAFLGAPIGALALANTPKKAATIDAGTAQQSTPAVITNVPAAPAVEPPAQS